MHGRGKEGTDSPIATGTAASTRAEEIRGNPGTRARANPAQFQRSFWRARALQVRAQLLSMDSVLFVHHVSSSFSLPLLVQQCSSSFIISPLRSSFLLFGHLASSLPLFLYSPLRSSFLLFLHPSSSSFIILTPLRTSFVRYIHHFSFPFITFPLRSSAAGHVGRVLGDFSFCTSIKPDTAVSAYISLLRSSCPEARGAGGGARKG